MLIGIDLISKRPPSPAHLAISQIQQEKGNSLIFTQNVDNLHKQAGSKNIAELHWNIFRVTCINCGFNDNFNIIVDISPRYPKCGNVIKPDVVLFGESSPQKDLGMAIEIDTSCDVMSVIGTSLDVSPVNILPSCAKDNNAVIIEINPKLTWLGKSVDFSLKGSASDILPRIYNLLKLDGH